MTVKAETPKRIVLLAGKKALPSSAFVCRTARDAASVHSAVRAVLQNVARTSAQLAIWIVGDNHLGDQLVAEAARSWTAQRRGLGDLLFLERPRPEALLPAHAFFNHVAWIDSRKHWLPLKEMFEVLSLPNARNYIIGGLVDQQTGTLTVYRGDLSAVTVPLSVFRPSGDGLAPDLTDFSVIDGGQAVRLGGYEATADVIFYEGDPAYRRQLNKVRKEEEKGLGPALRRLRIQRGLRQSDFDNVPSKTIARIERGEIARPQRRTLEAIAGRLGVAAEEIETF